MAKADVVVRNPLMDWSFDAIFFILIITSSVMTLKDDTISYFLSYGAITTVVILVSTWASGAFGSWVSRTFLSKPPFSDPIASPITRHKLTAQAWQLVVHTTMSIIALQLISETDWMEKMWMTASWDHLPNSPPKSLDLMKFHIVQLAIWTVTCVSHRFVEEKHKDYYVMYAHHLTAIAIIVFSYTFNYMRVGLVVSMIHDTSDVVLDLMKILNLFKLTDKEAFFITEIVYVIQMCCWIYTRLYLFPKLVIQSLCYNLFMDTLPDGQPSLAVVMWEADPEQYYFETRVMIPIALPLLIALQIMHVWWTFLLLRIGYRGLVGGENIHDVGRDEYEGDSEDESDGKKKHK